MSFRYINDHGLELEKIIAMYHPLHEAEVSPLKKARERSGLTQKELSHEIATTLK